jgi:DNA-binding response OmpR family regulator
MRKILVLDELVSLGTIYSDLLLKNYEVEASNDGNEMLPRFNRFRPDILIVNADLPHLDLVLICSKIKGIYNTPILLLVDKNSARSSKIDGCHADAVLTKPFKKDELVHMINQMIATFN